MFMHVFLFPDFSQATPGKCVPQNYSLQQKGSRHISSLVAKVPISASGKEISP